MPIAYSYKRFSDPKQARGTSEKRQAEGVGGNSPAKWCQEHGYELRDLKPDRGKSGYHGEHLRIGHLGVFLAMARARQIPEGAALIVEHLDRLSRQDPYTAMGTIRDIINAGVDLVVLSTGKKYSRSVLATEPMSQVEIGFALIGNHEESRKKSDRLKYLWEQKREDMKAGKKVTQRRPGWIRKDGTVDEAKAQVVRQVFALAATGLGVAAITRRLNGDGIPLVKKAKHWTTGLVRYYLTTRNVIGEFQPHRVVNKVYFPEGEPIKGYYPPIVDEKTFATVQRLIASRKKVKLAGRTTTTPNLFTRLLFNLYDGSPVYYKESRKVGRKGRVSHTRRLVSRRAVDGIKGAMAMPLAYETFESAFFRFVMEVDLDALFTPADETGRGARLAALLDQLADLEDRVRTSEGMFKTSRNRDRWAKQLDEAETERGLVAGQVERIRQEMVTSERRICEDIRANLADPESRARVASALRQVVDRIDLLPIHRATRERKQFEYLLYAEVHFSNGQRRVFITDDRGTAVPTQVSGALVGYTLRGDGSEAPLHALATQAEAMSSTSGAIEGELTALEALWTPAGARRAILTELISQASDQWRGRLQAWLEGV